MYQNLRQGGGLVAKMSNMRVEQGDRQRVAGVILHRRVSLGMTQEDLAAASGVSLRTVQNAESGDSVIQVLTRARLERALEFPLGYLTQLYGDERIGHSNGKVDEFLTPKIIHILEHPDLSAQDRAFIKDRLQKIHAEFVETIEDLFRLRHEGSRDGRPRR